MYFCRSKFYKVPVKNYCYWKAFVYRDFQNIYSVYALLYNAITGVVVTTYFETSNAIKNFVELVPAISLLLVKDKGRIFLEFIYLKDSSTDFIFDTFLLSKQNQGSVSCRMENECNDSFQWNEKQNLVWCVLEWIISKQCNSFHFDNLYSLTTLLFYQFFFAFHQGIEQQFNPFLSMHL